MQGLGTVVPISQAGAPAVWASVGVRDSCLSPYPNTLENDTHTHAHTLAHAQTHPHTCINTLNPLQVTDADPKTELSRGRGQYGGARRWGPERGRGAGAVGGREGGRGGGREGGGQRALVVCRGALHEALQ